MLVDSQEKFRVLKKTEILKKKVVPSIFYMQFCISLDISLIGWHFRMSIIHMDYGLKKYEKTFYTQKQNWYSLWRNKYKTYYLSKFTVSSNESGVLNRYR